MNIRFYAKERRLITDYAVGTRFTLKDQLGYFDLEYAGVSAGLNRLVPELREHPPSRDELRTLSNVLADEWHSQSKVPVPHTPWGTRAAEYPPVPRGWTKSTAELKLIFPGGNPEARRHSVLDLRSGHAIFRRVVGYDGWRPYLLVPWQPTGAPLQIKLPAGDWIRKLIIKHAGEPEAPDKGMLKRLHTLIQISLVNTMLSESRMHYYHIGPPEEHPVLWRGHEHIRSLGYLTLHFPEMIPHLPPSVLAKVQNGLREIADTPVKWRMPKGAVPPPPRLREAMHQLNVLAGLVPPPGKPSRKRKKKEEKTI